MKKILIAAAALFAVVGCKKNETTTEQTTTSKSESAPGVVAPPPLTTGTGKETGTEGTFRVETVTLGRAVGADKTIPKEVTTFGPKDTIFAAVKTVGPRENVVLAAKWTQKAQSGDVVVNESEQRIEALSNAQTVFQIEKPEGWPVGSYKVEISKDNHVVSTKEFAVTAAGTAAASN